MLCAWKTNGRRECVEPGEIRVSAGPRWLCRSHVAALDRLREERRRRSSVWKGFEETTVERAARLKG